MFYYEVAGVYQTAVAGDTVLPPYGDDAPQQETPEAPGLPAVEHSYREVGNFRFRLPIARDGDNTFSTLTGGDGGQRELAWIIKMREPVEHFLGQRTQIP